MAFAFVGPEPLEQQIQRALDRIAAGEAPSALEGLQVDCKEEPGRRGPAGKILPGAAENENAAAYLWAEMGCLANTPGGGAVILGVADDGRRIGTELDGEWLRHRIYELSERRLTVDVRAGHLDGVRILTLKSSQAIEPLRVKGKITWRVDDHCVEVDAATWFSHQFQRIGVDWSALPSGHHLTDVSPAAVEVARDFLGQAASTGDQAAQSLLQATDADLLRRLNLVDGDDVLTNAGALLFVGTDEDGIDYIRRDVAAGDSTNRVRSTRPLIQQVHEVDQAINAANRVVHSGAGLARGQARAIPAGAAREAVVNGVVHRDWISRSPTTVEHVGDTLAVTSPGGFPGGVRADNIITHPSAPRYKSLAEAMSSLRLAEREGVGVDRMVRDMLAVGLAGPGISEMEGPWVRVSLSGGNPDLEIVQFLSSLDPAAAAEDLNVVLLLDHLCRHGFVDVETAQPVLQRSADETAAALRSAVQIKVDDSAVFDLVTGVPDGLPSAWRLSNAATARLPRCRAALSSPAARERIILEWANLRGRVSSTEVASLTGLSQVRTGQILTDLENEGRLAPSRRSKAGRGFFYVPVPS